jgi:hypothetical protein
MEYKFIYTTYDVKQTLTVTAAGHIEKRADPEKPPDVLDGLSAELNWLVAKENWRVRQFAATPGTATDGREKVIYTMLLEREAPEPEKDDNMPSPTS